MNLNLTYRMWYKFHTIKYDNLIQLSMVGQVYIYYIISYTKCDINTVINLIQLSMVNKVSHTIKYGSQ